LRRRLVFAKHHLIVAVWDVERCRSGKTSIIVPCASPLAAMKAPSSGPNGKHLPPISSASTSATCCGSRAGIDT
jgi:hypothetical protein